MNSWICDRRHTTSLKVEQMIRSHPIFFKMILRSRLTLLLMLYWSASCCPINALGRSSSAHYNTLLNGNRLIKHSLPDSHCPIFQILTDLVPRLIRLVFFQYLPLLHVSYPYPLISILSLEYQPFPLFLDVSHLERVPPAADVLILKWLEMQLTIDDIIAVGQVAPRCLVVRLGGGVGLLLLGPGGLGLMKCVRRI